MSEETKRILGITLETESLARTLAMVHGARALLIIAKDAAWMRETDKKALLALSDLDYVATRVQETLLASALGNRVRSHPDAEKQPNHMEASFDEFLKLLAKMVIGNGRK